LIHAAPEIPPQFVTQMAAKVEQAGLHSFWVNDRVVYDNLDAITTIAAAAGVTRRIKLGTSVLLAPVRHPVLLAKSLATVDFLSVGRLICGFGLGNRKDDYESAGVPFERRGARMAEGIELMKKLWREASGTHQGKFYQTPDLVIGPRPIQSEIPIWIGGSAEPALKRAARLADGYLCGSSGLQRFPELWEKISGYATAAGRDPAAIDKAALTFIAIDDDKRRAVAACEAYLKRYYGKVPVNVETLMVVGAPAACAERIAAIANKGIGTLILGLVVPDLRQIDLLTEKILPNA
jgi:probable F420-dependent oxidoreductase